MGTLQAAGGMTRTVTVDLDNAGDIDRVWRELARRHRLRTIAPTLRALIETCLSDAGIMGRLDAARIAEIRGALDELHPSAVLEAYARDLIDDRPALGAFR